MESLTGKVAKRFYLKDNQGPRGPVTKLHLAEHKMTRTIATLPPPILRWDASPSQTTLPFLTSLKYFFWFIPTVPFVVSLCFTLVHHPLGTRDKEI